MGQGGQGLGREDRLSAVGPLRLAGWRRTALALAVALGLTSAAAGGWTRFDSWQRETIFRIDPEQLRWYSEAPEGTEVFDLAPARAVLLDAANELALHLADLVRVRGIEDDAVRNVAELAAEAREELLDARAALELTADEVSQLGKHRVDCLEREDAPFHDPGS